MISLKDVIETCSAYGNKFYSLSAIIKTLKLDRTDARRKLGRLERAGLITRAKETKKSAFMNDSNGRPQKEIIYNNKRSLKKKLDDRLQLKNAAWDRMWQAARMLRQFTRNDLVIVCKANIENVRYFTKAYTKAGYLRAGRGKGLEKVWTLIQDPGPRRPHYERV
jgi:predicted transcriptional regulator